MSHQYTIATRGVVLSTGLTPNPTALAWADGTVLAVGDDAAVRALSRGDSTFVDLAGRAVSAGTDPDTAVDRLRGAVASGAAGTAADALPRLEPGSPADLLIWSSDPRRLEPADAASLSVVGVVRGGRLSWSQSGTRT